MRKIVGLMVLVCAHASAAGLILTLSDPNQAVAPGTDAIFHGTLLNSDTVGYNILSFVMLNPPTDATIPGGPLFPATEPAVPFHLAAGDQFTGIVVDIAVPGTAQIRDHIFQIEAATDVTGPNGTVVSNSVTADLNVVPEPATAVLLCAGFAGLCLAAIRRNRTRL